MLSPGGGVCFDKYISKENDVLISIDTDKKTIQTGDGKTLELYSRESFEMLSELWLKVGWNEKNVYTYTWMGRPIIQLPEDVLRIQEVIYNLKPDVIIETGIAHGGSLVLYATLCKAIGKGRVIGIDIEVRAANRKALESHELRGYITIVEGSSVDPLVVNKVKSLVKPDEVILVILDSNHSKAHVLSELESYCSLVSKDSYVVATDGSMQILHDVPRGRTQWTHDNPVEAVGDFLKTHDNFQVEQPPWRFNESELSKNVTHWPNAYLKRIR
jgi:cephalosporin hydroxylase